MIDCIFRELCGNYREDSALCSRKIPRCNIEEFGKVVKNATLEEIQQRLDASWNYDTIMDFLDSLSVPLAPVPTPAVGHKKEGTK